VAHSHQGAEDTDVKRAERLNWVQNSFSHSSFDIGGPSLFVNSMSDLFHDAVPAEFVAAVWAATRSVTSVSEYATSSTARNGPDTDVDLAEVRSGDDWAPNSCTTLC
jgi:protein gp37